MTAWLRCFIREDEGQDLVEYALLAALIALAVSAAMSFLATSIGTEFNSVAGTVTSS
jgi:pilus assembly protein Flp/PilA